NSLWCGLVNHRLWPPRLIREDLFHRLEDALLAERREAHLAGWRIEDSRKQGFFELQRLPHTLFNAALGQQVHYVDGIGLSETVDPPDPLLEASGIPRRLEIDDRR